jgi:hypothetical protein
MTSGTRKITWKWTLFYFAWALLLGIYWLTTSQGPLRMVAVMWLVTWVLMIPIAVFAIRLQKK